MQRIVIDNIIEEIAKCVESHKFNTGEYARWLWGENRDLGVNPYGCADAANILYTIGRFPTDVNERAKWIEALQKMQDKETGLYNESTHHPIHTTAHCTAALELFDAKPLYKCTALEKYTTKEGLYELLEKEVDWQNPWPQSHKGAGILPSLTNTDAVDLTWKDWYFDWMWEHSDEENGFFYFGNEPKTAPLSHYMAGGFHYIFNHESEHRPLRYPDKIIDSCIHIMSNTEDETQKISYIKHCGFSEIDVVYCLSRAMRQTPHRFYEAKQSLENFGERYINFMANIDYKNDSSFNDLHMLFGSVCCVAELQSALPGKIITTKPLKLVLDRRPFI